MKKRKCKVIMFLLIVLLIGIVSFRHYQKEKILKHMNNHISLLKQIGDEINEKDLQDGDDEYLNHIIVLLIDSINEYYDAYYIREKYRLWGEGIISLTTDFRIIMDQVSHLKDCTGVGIDEKLKEKYLLYIQSDLTNIASYLTEHYPDGVKKYGDWIYKSSTWKEYEREVMNFGFGTPGN